MTVGWHPLLLRQMRRAGIDGAKSPDWPPGFADLAAHISRAYREHDEGTYLLQRSQDLASQEMAALYDKLQAERDLLDSRVQERTAALQLSEGRLSSLLSLSADWIWEQDAELRFTYFSAGLQATAGVDPASLIGKQRLASAAFDAPPEAIAAYEDCIHQRRAFRDFTYAFTRPDGQRRYISISGQPVFGADAAFGGYRGIGRDVTQATEADQRVAELARIDSLTGLPNRVHFTAELERSIARARRLGHSFALLFLDLDRFKTVNDRLGHAAGDELLRTMSQRLHKTLRENDLVARLGGDEFVALVEGDCQPATLELIARKLMKAICQPIVIQGCEFLLTGSIGIAVYPEHGQEASTLLKHADAAMYQAKAAGKNDFRCYTPALADRASSEFELESALRLALVRDEFVLHYQPKLGLRTGEMVGMEALVRWQHPTRGLVGPVDFIPLAEERGLIVALGRWVIEAACRQIAAWQAAGYQPPPVAVNLSARQFASGTLVQDIRGALDLHGVHPRELEVELTESVLMAEPESASELLQQLHAMGVRIAIDDFGTGYSSLSYLKRFPAQTVKLDRSFVRGLPEDANDKAITEAVIALAHSLGLGVVAEGVETRAQLDLLSRLGCDEVQGYLLGKPMGADALTARLEKSRLQQEHEGGADQANSRLMAAITAW